MRPLCRDRSSGGTSYGLMCAMPAQDGCDGLCRYHWARRWPCTTCGRPTGHPERLCTDCWQGEVVALSESWTDIRQTIAEELIDLLGAGPLPTPQVKRAMRERGRAERTYERVATMLGILRERDPHGHHHKCLVWRLP